MNLNYRRCKKVCSNVIHFYRFNFYELHENEINVFLLYKIPAEITMIMLNEIKFIL